MSLVLYGNIKGMRPVGGISAEGYYEGQSWNYLSMEVVDPLNGESYSCQLRSNNANYASFVKVEKGAGPKDPKSGKKLDKLTLLQDWTGHNAKFLVGAAVPGERKKVDKEGNEIMVPIVRLFIDQMEDQGAPKVEGW